jgi:gliding motility-associated-like protein
LNSVTNQSISGSTSLNPLTLNVSPTATSTYTVTTVHDKYCVGTQLNGSAQVTVNPLPVPVIAGDNQICDGETSVLTTTLPYSSYVWSNTQTSASIGATITGNYSVLVTDANGCKKTSPSFAVTVNNVPIADFTNDTSKTCEIPKINFTNLSTYDAGSTFLWNLGENTIATEENPSHVYVQPGNFPIELIVTTPAGCADTVGRNVDIRFYPLPVAQFKADPSTTNIYSGPISFIDQSQYAVKWHWQFADLDSTSEQNVMFTFPDIGDYIVKLTVENVSGCLSETEQQIVVNPFYLPSGFTPNGDGKNEVFFNPGFSMDYQGFNLRIFNKWGQMFYQTNTYANPWDGLDNKGKPAPQGVYVYSLNITSKSGKEHQYNGTITLLR